MPSLIYAPVYATAAFSTRPWLTTSLGFRPPGRGDGHFLPPHRTPASHSQTQALQFHLREPSRRQIPVWHEGRRLHHRILPC